MTFKTSPFVPSLRVLPGLLLLIASGCTHPGTPSHSTAPVTPAAPTAPAAPATAAVEGAFDDDAHKPTPIETSVIAAGKDAAKQAAVERELLATMQKPGAAPALVQEAAQHLAYVLQSGATGPDAATLAALAPMLTDPARSDYARLALDRVPGESIDALYLKALPTTSGRTRIGLIESLGSRRVVAAVPALALGLQDSDPAVVTATAQSLGRIGGAAALAALESAKDSLAPAVLNARLAAARKTDDAHRVAAAIYGNPAVPLPQRSAALRQLIDASPTDAVREIHTALVGNEPTFHAVAIHAVSTLPAPGSAAELASRLSSYPPAVQVPLIAALGTRGDAGAIPGLLRALEGTDADVRLAVLEALGRLPGNTDVAHQLALRAAGSGAEAKTAFASLARLNGPGLDVYIRTSAASGDAALQPVFIQQIAARNLTDAVPFLLGLRQSPVESLRFEALDALRAIAPPSSQQAVIDWALGTQSKTEQNRAARTLVTMILRDDNLETRADPLLAALASGDTAARLVLLPVLSRVPGAKTLASAGSLALSSDETLAPAAVAELARWTDDSALPLLVKVAGQTQVPAARSAAVLGAARFLARKSSLSPAERSAQARSLLALPVGVPEQLALLNVLSLCADQPALETAQRYLADPATAEAARDAVDAITSNLAGAPTCQVSNSAADLANLTDGKPGTSWSVPGTPGEWIMADLHHSRPVRKVTLDNRVRGYFFPAKIEVQVSDDPAQPGEARAQVEGQRDETVVTLPAGVRGRYLWVRQVGNRDFPWWVSELLVE